MLGYKEPENVEKKESLKSQADPECGYVTYQVCKKMMDYLTEITVDTRYGTITELDRFPAIQRKSDIIQKHLKEPPPKYQEIGLDGGYDIGAVHKGLELSGVQGYTVIREYPNNAVKKDSFTRKKQTALYVDRKNIQPFRN